MYEVKNFYLYFFNITKITGLVLALFLFGCVTQEVETQKHQGKVSPLTVTTPGFEVVAGAHIAWYSEGVRFYKDPRIDNVAIKSMIDQSIVNELSDQGYALSLDVENADYLLGYAAALESSLNSDAILLRYGLMFGDGVKGPLDEQATLVLYLLDRKSKAPVWKSIARGAFDFTSTNAERSLRVQEIVKHMLSTLKPTQRKVSE